MDSPSPSGSVLPMHTELRERVPELHPYTALILTLDTMAVREEISPEAYLRWAAMLVVSHGKPLYTPN